MNGEGHSDGGFTLLELVAVLAIFALVATMGVQALQGALRTQRALAARGAATAELEAALGQLRHDLEHAAPLVFVTPGGTVRAAFEVGARGQGFTLSLAGLAGFDARPGQGRVEWQFDQAAGALTRRMWPLLAPAEAEQAGPVQSVIGGIEDLRIFTYAPETGWSSGWEMPGDAGPATLPAAVRVEIDSRDWGELSLLERF